MRMDRKELTDEFKRAAVERMVPGDISALARELGISRQRLYEAGGGVSGPAGMRCLAISAPPRAMRGRSDRRSHLDDRFRETGRHGTSDVFVDSPFGFD